MSGPRLLVGAELRAWVAAGRCRPPAERCPPPHRGTVPRCSHGSRRRGRWRRSSRWPARSRPTGPGRLPCCRRRWRRGRPTSPVPRRRRPRRSERSSRGPRSPRGSRPERQGQGHRRVEVSAADAARDVHADHDGERPSEGDQQPVAGGVEDGRGRGGPARPGEGGDRHGDNPVTEGDQGQRPDELAGGGPRGPCRPNVCRPAPCIGRYSSAMPNPPIGRPSDNLAHLWKTGGAPAPVAQPGPASAPLLPSRTFPPLPLGAVGVRPALDALAIIRYRRALSTHFSECPTDQVGYPDAAADFESIQRAAQVMHLLSGRARG